MQSAFCFVQGRCSKPCHPRRLKSLSSCQELPMGWRKTGERTRKYCGAKAFRRAMFSTSRKANVVSSKQNKSRAHQGKDLQVNTIRRHKSHRRPRSACSLAASVSDGIRSLATAKTLHHIFCREFRSLQRVHLIGQSQVLKTWLWFGILLRCFPFAYGRTALVRVHVPWIQKISARTKCSLPWVLSFE